MEDFPRARQAARGVAQQILRLAQQGSPPTELAIVANTDFQVSNGYVMATTRKGPIRVFGADAHSLIPGMRIYARRMTFSGLNDYVYDGRVLGNGLINSSSGAVSTTGLVPAAQSGAITGPNQLTNPSPVMVVPGGAPAGWFWSFFFYISDTPPVTAPTVLLDMPLLNGTYGITSGFRITYDYLGQLSAYFYNWGGSATVFGTSTTQTFAPHRAWHATFQLGNGLLMDGADFGNNVISRLTAGQTLTAGNYGLFLLSDSAGLNEPSPGSWISKIVIGNNYASSAPVWPYAPGVVPVNDADIVNGNAALGSGLRVYGRWLCGDSGGSTLPDTALAGTPTNLLISGQLLTAGPY